MDKRLVFLCSSYWLTRIPSLIRVSSKSGLRAVSLLFLLSIFRPFQIQTRTTLVATLSSLIWSWYTKSTNILRWVIAFASVPVLSDFLRAGDADIPAVCAIILGLLLDHCSAAGVILIMVTGGEALEELALERAGSALHTLLEKNPATARLAQSGNIIPANEINKNDEVIVKQAEVFPVDGYIVSSDTCLVDEQLLTGECISATKYRGDFVMAGSTNHSAGPVQVKASGNFEDSILSQMKTSLQGALERKAKIELSSKKLADSLTPLTLVISMFAFEWAVRRKELSFEKAWSCVLSVMMSATPCPAAIGVPIAMLSGMSVSSRMLGATVKSAEAFEALSDAKVIVLDKTGTITTGKPIVENIELISSKEENLNIDLNLALDYLAHVEFQAKHVLADAVVNQFGGSISRKVTEFQSNPGLGVSGVVDNIYVKVGSKSYCDPNNEIFHEQNGGDKLVTYFSFVSNSTRKKLYGSISFTDPIRVQAKELVAECKKQGMMIVVLSGDSSKHLRWVCEQLKVDQYHVCLPHEKVQRICELQQKFGIVIMVGDGANDSPALSASDVGISVDPSSMATESAKIVILNGDVSKIIQLIRLSKHVVSVAKRTVRLGMTASSIQMIVAAFGISSPFVNAVFQECIDLSSVFHALTALTFQPYKND